MTTRRFVESVTAALALAIAALASAQSTTGVVTGTVTDEQGLALPGATVELVNEDTDLVRATTSLENGGFTFPAVPQGRYTLRTTLSGFSIDERTGIQLTSNETFSTGRVTLRIGNVTEVVTVTTGAVVQTASSELSSTIEAQQIDSLVARGRDPMTLFSVMPGVASTGGGIDGPVSLGGTNGTGLPTVSGLPANLGGISLDGMPTNDADTNVQMSIIGTDAIEEIKLLSNNYQAEHGRAAGASMTIVSKSGSNVFRGGYTYYVRDDALNENSFFNIRNDLPKPFYRYDTGSGTIGGPIGRPGGDNKLFFFYAREDWVNDEPRTPNRVTVPTGLERQGDFSQTVDLDGALIPIIDPLTGSPFPGNRIPANRINPLGQAILDILPTPNFSDVAVSNRQYNYQFQDVRHSTKAMNHLKVDYQATRQDRLTFIVRNWDPLITGYGDLFGLESNWNQLEHNYAKSEWDWQVKHVRSFGLSVVNEASVGFRRTREIYHDPDFNAVSIDRYGLAGLPYLFPDADPFGVFPQASFGGVPSAGSLAFESGRFPINAGDQRWVVSDKLSWSTANHLVKAGFLYEWDYNSEGLDGPCYSGCFDFGRDTNNSNDAGHAYANALLGNFGSYSQSNLRAFRGARNSVLEGFVQDSWKPHQDLTLELGVRISSANSWKLDVLRYGHAVDVAASKAMGPVGGAFVMGRYDPAQQPRLFVPTRRNGQRVGFDAATGQVVPAALIGAIVPGSGDPFNGVVTQDDASAAHGFRNPPGPQVAPRLGFAWDVRGDGDTAIRGGFGITKQTITNSGSVAGGVANGPPARIQPVVFYGNLSTLAQATGVLRPFDVEGFALDWEPTTIYNYSVNVQQRLPFSTVLSVAYVGNRARHLPRSKDLNVIPPGARFDPANLDPTTNRPLPDNFLRPIVGYDEVGIAQHTGESEYDSLQITFNRRYSDSLQYGAAYTYSVARDDAGTVPLYRDARSYLWDYASFDRRHVLSINYVWDLPNASALWDHRVVRAVLDNWQLAGVTSFSSGTPDDVTFSTTDGADILGGGDPGRISVTCDPNLPRGERTFDRWFDTSCFARPAPGDPGNASRQMIRLPGRHNWDITVSKTLVRLSRFRLQFRAELYNAFNQVQWTSVGTSARFDAAGNQIDPGFGQITGTADPRVMQLSLRATF